MRLLGVLSPYTHTHTHTHTKPTSQSPSAPSPGCPSGSATNCWPLSDRATGCGATGSPGAVLPGAPGHLGALPLGPFGVLRRSGFRTVGSHGASHGLEVLVKWSVRPIPWWFPQLKQLLSEEGNEFHRIPKTTMSGCPGWTTLHTLVWVSRQDTQTGWSWYNDVDRIKHPAEWTLLLRSFALLALDSSFVRPWSFWYFLRAKVSSTKQPGPPGTSITHELLDQSLN